MKRVLILEDNEACLQYLAQIVKEVDNTAFIYLSKSVEEAYPYMLEQRIDLFLIDIILRSDISGDISGLYFANKVRMIKQYFFVPLVFITSLEDTKCIAYDKFHCYKFIEKPFDPKKVKSVIRDCLKFSSEAKEDKQLFFRKDGVILVVEIKNILFAETINHILHIHTRNDVLKIPYITLKKFLQEADCEKLIQCSRNSIINKEYIKNIDVPNRTIQLSTGDRVEIGITFKNIIKGIINVTPDKLHT